MRRAEFLLPCSWLAMLVACTMPSNDPNARAEPEPPASAPEPNNPGEPMNREIIDPITEVDLQDYEALARACEGARVREHLRSLSPGERFELEGGSLGLLEIWASDHNFVANGTLWRASLDRFTSALELELGQAPPSWWIDQLASAKRTDVGDLPHYDVGLTAKGDRRGAWKRGPGTTRVRPDGAMLLSESAGQLSYDFSMGRVVLGPLPTEPGMMIEHARAQGATTVYYASFSPGSGGFRFPLHAVRSDGTLAWTTEVCGPDRQLLGGLGHLTVEIVVLDRGARVAVFTAESHGVALDVFDPTNGTRTLAWSSNFWFAP